MIIVTYYHKQQLMSITILKEGEYMKLNRNKVDVAMARKKMTVVQLAEAYGVSRARMNVILNSQVITPVCAGRVADALGVDVTEIIEQLHWCNRKEEK